MTDEQKKRRNTIIAASIGAFLLPLAGLIGAAIFYARDDRQAGWTVLVGSALGIVFYLLLFGAG